MKSTVTWTVRIDGGGDIPNRSLIGGKAWSIARMSHLGLQVPAAFVITTEAHRRYVQTGELWPELLKEINDGLEWLATRTGRQFDGKSKPLQVSVRSGAAISMPGMMDTVLNLGIHRGTRDALIAEFGDAAFVEDTHRRFLSQYANIVLGIASIPSEENDALGLEDYLKKSSPPLPANPHDQLYGAVRAVFEFVAKSACTAISRTPRY